MPGRGITLYGPARPAGLVLTDPGGGYRVLTGVKGLGTADVDLSTDTSPLIDGAIVTDVYAPPRTLLIPIMVTGDTVTDLRARLRDLLTLMDPRVPGELEVAAPDGTRRRIAYRYSAGLEGLDDASKTGDTFYMLALELMCPDPYWYDPQERSIGATAADDGTDFFPIPGDDGGYLHLAPSVVLGDVEIDNPGDVATPILWTITRPATGVALVDSDTGDTITLATAIPTGHRLEIDTDPVNADVRLVDLTTGARTDWWDQLTGTNPVLWGARPGLTHVSLTATGSGDGTSITGTYRPRYRASW